MEEKILTKKQFGLVAQTAALLELPTIVLGGSICRGMSEVWGGVCNKALLFNKFGYPSPEGLFEN